jgi:hypothetical protein
MAYDPFDPARPDLAYGGATRSSEIAETRANLTALADMMASLGWMDNFNVTISAGPADAPTEILATNGSQIVKTNITYGAGVTAGLPTVIVEHKSTDTGATYDSIRTGTISYDGSANFVSLVWT